MTERLTGSDIGVSDHRRVVAEIIEQVGVRWIVGFVDDDPVLQGRCLGRYPILGDRRVLQGLRDRGVDRRIIAIGSNSARSELASLAKGLGLGLITVIHPLAHISPGATIGEGSMAGTLHGDQDGLLHRASAHNQLLCIHRPPCAPWRGGAHLTR